MRGGGGDAVGDVFDDAVAVAVVVAAAVEGMWLLLSTL